MTELSRLNFPALALLLVTVVMIWRLPRRLALYPLFIVVCLMPLGQDIVILGLHFRLFRVLLLVGMVRVIVRGEAARLQLNRTDRYFYWWIAVSLILGSLSNPSTDLFVSRLGDAYNAFASYFFVRCVVTNLDDLVASIRALALLCLPLAALMLLEKTTSHNLLAVFGGVPEITAVREGHLRCQGAFRHPILAGTFGAAQIPFFAALWYCDRRSRLLAGLALLAALIIAITASSSGALMAVLAAFAGLAMWSRRRHLRFIWWTGIGVICAAAVLMNAPVWYLFAHLSNVAGGGGWHRAWLLDQTIKHLGEWWLFGTTYTAHWGPAGEVIAADPNMMDITNHYVMEGVKGGLLKLGLFLVIVVRCFKSIGYWVRSAPRDTAAPFLGWATGVSLAVHCLSFLSITYFDQTIVIWYWLVAVIVGLAPDRPPVVVRRVRLPARSPAGLQSHPGRFPKPRPLWSP